MRALDVGEKFTIDGVGYDAEGWLVINGHRIDGTKSEPKELHVWTAVSGEHVKSDSAPAKIKPAIIAAGRFPNQRRKQPQLQHGPRRGRW